MKKYFVLLIAVAVTALSFAGNANAQDDVLPFKRTVIMEKLNLTDAQKEQFSDIIFAHRNAVIDLRSEAQKNRLAVKKMMMDNEIDANELKSLTSANSDIQAKIKESQVDMWLDVYNILNEEQQEIWAQHFAMMGQRMGDRFGRGFDGKRGGGMGMMDGSGPNFKDGRRPRR